jgi:hypothetical protein
MNSSRKSRRAAKEIIKFVERHRGVGPEKRKRLERLCMVAVNEFEDGRSRQRLHAAVENLMSELLQVKKPKGDVGL